MGVGRGRKNDVCDGAAKEDVIIIIEIIIALVIISDKNDNNAEGDSGPRLRPPAVRPERARSNVRSAIGSYTRWDMNMHDDGDSSLVAGRLRVESRVES